MPEDQGPWTDDEIALRSLPREEAPPAWLEDRVVTELKARGIVRARRSPRRVLVAASVLAASIALFVVGLATGTRLAPRAVPENPAGRQFLLLLYEDGAYENPPAGAESSRVEEYAAWARNLRRGGTVIAGEKLKPEGRIVGEDNGRVVVSDVSVAAGEEVLAGYFVVAAADAAAASAIARECPHLKHRGRIAIREIDRL